MKKKPVIIIFVIFTLVVGISFIFLQQKQKDHGSNNAASRTLTIKEHKELSGKSTPFYFNTSKLISNIKEYVPLSNEDYFVFFATETFRKNKWKGNGYKFGDDLSKVKRLHKRVNFIVFSEFMHKNLNTAVDKLNKKQAYSVYMADNTFVEDISALNKIKIKNLTISDSSPEFAQKKYSLRQKSIDGYLALDGLASLAFLENFKIEKINHLFIRKSSDIKGLKDFLQRTKVNKLTIESCDINDLPPVELEYLYISNCKLNFRKLEPELSVKKLIISNCNVVNLADCFKEVKQLYCSGMDTSIIASIKQLPELKQLAFITLSGEYDLSFIKKMKLNKLCLLFEKIKSLDALKNSSVTTLHLVGMPQLTDLQFIKETKISELKICNCRGFKDFSPLAKSDVRKLSIIANGTLGNKDLKQINNLALTELDLTYSKYEESELKHKDILNDKLHQCELTTCEPW